MLQSRVGSMMILRLLAVIFGVALIVLVALDAFETIVLPRRVTRRIRLALIFVFLALVISYVPVIYQAFSRRERRISLLDARAGSPPTAVELLRRNSAVTHPEELRTLLHEWEVWCADILESHLSYPILAYYRSQHEQQSWVEALTVILDTCALILTSLEVPPLPAARYTFAAARHAVVDLAQVLGASPMAEVNRLSTDEWTR